MFEFWEIFSGAGRATEFVASFGVVCGPPIDLSRSEEFNLRYPHLVEWISHLIAEQVLKAVLLMPPSTALSITRRPVLRDKDHAFAFNPHGKQTSSDGGILAQRSFQFGWVAAATRPLQLAYGLAHLASGIFHIRAREASQDLLETEGLENQLVNDVMPSSDCELQKVRKFKANRQRKAEQRAARPMLPEGRPTLEVTTRLRQRCWKMFLEWTVLALEGIDFDALLVSCHHHVDEINAVQGAWDFAFSLVRAEPSAYHVAMPWQVLLAMTTVALPCSWERFAGCLALGR
eukprot:s386_g28.t1